MPDLVLDALPVLRAALDVAADLVQVAAGILAIRALCGRRR